MIGTVSINMFTAGSDVYNHDTLDQIGVPLV